MPGLDFSGWVSLRLTSADPVGALDAMRSASVEVRDLIWDGADLELSFRIPRKQKAALRKLAGKKGWALTLSHESGVVQMLLTACERPVLLFGIAAMLLLTIWCPTRIFFLRVEGNSCVDEREILSVCADVGLVFGAKRADVRSEKIKNALLAKIPLLQWAGVNTTGCCAVISVRERTDETIETQNGVCSLIAARDGIILSATVTRGSALCAPGQAVSRGQVLVSGYTDCGLTVRADCAQGEIFALTSRELTVVAPEQVTQKADSGKKHICYALQIGKKRINFCKCSGILHTSCDKIYSEYYLTLPGGFVLPLALIRTERVDCASQAVTADTDLAASARSYLLAQMIAGSILHEQTSLCADRAQLRLEGRYICTEMIALIRNEETILQYGNDYGTNR